MQDIIEFMGVPGAGKSTLSNELVTQLKERGEIVKHYGDMHANDKHKVKAVQYFNPLLFSKFLLTILIYAVPLFLLLLFILVNRLFDWHVWKRFYVIVKEILKRSILVFDTDCNKAVINQGLFQALLSISYLGRKPWQIVTDSFIYSEKLIKQLGLNVWYIYVQVDSEMAINRVDSRPNQVGDVNNYEGDRLKAFYDSAIEYSLDLIKTIQKYDVEHITLDGNDEIRLSVCKVKNYLDSKFKY